MWGIFALAVLAGLAAGFSDGVKHEQEKHSKDYEPDSSYPDWDEVKRRKTPRRSNRKY